MDRDKVEAELARLIGHVLTEEMQNVLDEIMAGSPSVDNIDAAVWERMAAKLRDVLEPFLADVATQSAVAFIASVGADVAWELVNKGAQEWAKQYTFDLVKGVIDTTTGAVNTQVRQALADAIAHGFDKGQTHTTIADALAPMFGPVRAEMIAVTETTRADKLRDDGINMVAYWLTVRDNLVCPVCEPRDKQRQGDGWDEPPPAHINCRCGLRWKVEPV